MKDSFVMFKKDVFLFLLFSKVLISLFCVLNGVYDGFNAFDVVVWWLLSGLVPGWCKVIPTF